MSDNPFKSYAQIKAEDKVNSLNRHLVKQHKYEFAYIDPITMKKRTKSKSYGGKVTAEAAKEAVQNFIDEFEAVKSHPLSSLVDDDEESVVISPVSKAGNVRGRIYIISNDVNNIVYIGSSIASTMLSTILNHHRGASRKGFTAFYEAMKEIGYERFSIREVESFDQEMSPSDLLKRRNNYIANYRDSPLYNTASNKLSVNPTKNEAIHVEGEPDTLCSGIKDNKIEMMITYTYNSSRFDTPCSYAKTYGGNRSYEDALELVKAFRLLNPST